MRWRSAISGASFHTGQTFTFGETPSATKWNYLWENDYALADGSGIEDDAILTRHVSDGQITPDKLDLDPATAFVTTGQTTTSDTYTNLATTLSVTVNVGQNGLLLVLHSVRRSSGSTTSMAQHAAPALSGANTSAANDDNGGIYSRQTSSAAEVYGMAGHMLYTGLTPGATTVTQKYRDAAGGTASFTERRITAIPL